MTLDAAMSWEALAEPILALPEYQPSPKGGRPAWPALTMLKCVMLAKWFGLSDGQFEKCLRDRLSFRRFVGLRRNELDFALTLIAYNWKRSLSLDGDS